MILNELHERGAHQAMITKVGMRIATRKLQFWELQLVDAPLTSQAHRVDQICHLLICRVFPDCRPDDYDQTLRTDSLAQFREQASVAFAEGFVQLRCCPGFVGTQGW